MIFSYSHVIKFTFIRKSITNKVENVIFNLYDAVAYDTVCICAYYTSKHDMEMRTFQGNIIEQGAKE